MTRLKCIHVDGRIVSPVQSQGVSGSQINLEYLTFKAILDGFSRRNKVRI